MNVYTTCQEVITSSTNLLDRKLKIITSQALKCEKNGEGQLHRSSEKLRGITQSQGGEEYPTYSKKKEG
jgi:predicted transposase YbfD/YdcC